MLRVLIVEDNKIFREALKKRLDDNFSSFLSRVRSTGMKSWRLLNRSSQVLVRTYFCGAELLVPSG